MKDILARAGRWLAIRYRAKKLTNHEFSIISNTCVGGVMTHNVGEQFRSPTVNLIIYEEQFLVFCHHLKEYAECPVELPTSEEQELFAKYPHPVGILRGKDAGLPDINLLFVHYKTFEEAKEKWEARFRRLNYHDIFIVMDRGMDARDEILDEFHKLPYKHKVFFTHKEDPARWPDNFRFSYYTEKDYKNGALYFNIKRGLRTLLWMDEFDYVQWLNTGIVQRSGLRPVNTETE